MSFPQYPPQYPQQQAGFSSSAYPQAASYPQPPQQYGQPGGYLMPPTYQQQQAAQPSQPQLHSVTPSQNPGYPAQKPAAAINQGGDFGPRGRLIEEGVYFPSKGCVCFVIKRPVYENDRPKTQVQSPYAAQPQQPQPQPQPQQQPQQQPMYHAAAPAARPPPQMTAYGGYYEEGSSGEIL